MAKKPEIMLWLDSARGVYIPRDFAQSFADRAKHVANVTADEWQTLENGPDDEWYWETWSGVEERATVTDENGFKYRIYQDGDCWLIPVDMEWDEETEWFKDPESVD